MDAETHFEIETKAIRDFSSTSLSLKDLEEALVNHATETSILANRIIENIHYGKIPANKLPEALQAVLDNTGTPSLDTTFNLEPHLKAGGYDPSIYVPILDEYDNSASKHQGGVISVRRQRQASHTSAETQSEIETRAIRDFSSSSLSLNDLEESLVYHATATTILANRIIEDIHYGKIPANELQEALQAVLDNTGTPSLNTTFNLEPHLKAGKYDPSIYIPILAKYDDLASEHQGGAISARRQKLASQSHLAPGPGEPDR